MNDLLKNKKSGWEEISEEELFEMFSLMFYI